MRMCKSFGELRTLQHSRVAPCPPPMGASPFSTSHNRQRVATTSLHCSRLEESVEGLSTIDREMNSLSSTQRSRTLFRMDMSAAMDVLSDSSGRSLESIHVVFGDMDRTLSESLKERSLDEEAGFSTMGRSASASRAVPISMAPGQLTEAFQNATGSAQGSLRVARSAPVPVPRNSAVSNAVTKVSLPRTSAPETEKFVPPHILAGRHSTQDPLEKKGLGRWRGLSSLRARNAVFAQIGYLDGF